MESIYRVSASLGDVNKLKEEFNKGIMSCDIIDFSCDVINVSWTSSICHVTSLLFSALCSVFDYLDYFLCHLCHYVTFMSFCGERQTLAKCPIFPQFLHLYCLYRQTGAM